jgi:hypothetical protein
VATDDRPARPAIGIVRRNQAHGRLGRMVNAKRQTLSKQIRIELAANADHAIAFVSMNVCLGNRML